MAITVYSRRFKSELDKEQLERLYLQNVSDNIDAFRKFVYEDAECPICNVTGAHYVSEGYSRVTSKKVKQAHFAFRKPDDTDAHKVFCDHYNGPGKVRDSGGDAYIKLGKDGSDVTVLVRELVCRGIEHKIFDQTEIRNMRKWFTELRESGLYRSTLANQAHRLVKKDKGIRIFDRRELNNKYLAAMHLSKTIIHQYDNLRRKFTSPLSIMKNNQLLAVSALLLFVSDWNEDIAREKFNMLANAGASVLPDAGNVIGMNPFIHYDAWKIIHRVQDLMNSLPNFSDLDEEFQAEKQRLSELYGLNKGKA